MTPGDASHASTLTFAKQAKENLVVVL